MAGASVEPSHAGHERRISTLDGLRGAAALLVVFHHSLLSSLPWAANGYRGVYPATGTLGWWLYATPLHALWAGSDSVLVFFVLSGYVLALPAVKRGAAWFDASYYPRRLVRLYVPVWAAVVVAAAVHSSVSHHQVAGATWWLNSHRAAPTAASGLHMATVLRQQNVWAFTSVLWSLTWEVWFSLLLPLLLLIPLATRRHPRWALGAAAGLLALVDVGFRVGSGYLEFLPGFVLGSVLAFQIDTVTGLLKRVFGQATGWVLLCVGLVGLPAYEEITGNLHGYSSEAFPIAFLAASVLVVAALVPGPFAQFLSSPPVQWLGKVSFSLYLVHEPIVAAVAFALGGKPNVFLLLAVAVPISIVVAGLFYRLVESPTIRLARSVGIATLRYVPQRRSRPSVRAAD